MAAVYNTIPSVDGAETLGPKTKTWKKLLVACALAASFVHGTLAVTAVRGAGNPRKLSLQIYKGGNFRWGSCASGLSCKGARGIASGDSGTCVDNALPGNPCGSSDGGVDCKSPFEGESWWCTTTTHKYYFKSLAVEGSHGKYKDGDEFEKPMHVCGPGLPFR